MSNAATTNLSLAEAEELCIAAALAVGAGPDTARSIARASVVAEADGQPAVGLVHFLDYLAGFREGRIAPDARPALSRPLPAVIVSDAGGGVAHLGFDLAFDDIIGTARKLGVAIFCQNNAFTCGALGYFTARLAEQGLVALAATNGPALLAGSGSTKPVYCTNPLSFAAPSATGTPLLIDQASSATAFVRIRQAAQRGETIPSGWAIDPEGNPTTDPAQAMKGALLAFGGERGANIALMVEVLAAGLTNANWSLDAPSFTEGSQNPGSGLFVLAIDARNMLPDFEDRLDHQLHRLADKHGVHIPGQTKQEQRAHAAAHGLSVQHAVVDQLKAASKP